MPSEVKQIRPSPTGTIAELVTTLPTVGFTFDVGGSVAVHGKARTHPGCAERSVVRFNATARAPTGRRSERSRTAVCPPCRVPNAASASRVSTSRSGSTGWNPASAVPAVNAGGVAAANGDGAAGTSKVWNVGRYSHALRRHRSKSPPLDRATIILPCSSSHGMRNAP